MDPRELPRLESANIFEREERRCVDLLRIGSGGYGTVFVGYNGESRRPEAIKVSPLDFGSINELTSMSRLQHPNLVTFYHHYLMTGDYQHPALRSGVLCIYMEYMEVGSLSDVLRVIQLKEVEIITICREVLLGLYYLCCLQVVHRDIKSTNILLGFDGRVKICDFGSALQLHHPDYLTTAPSLGTPGWVAPEVETGLPYGTPIDVWSLGVVLLEMIEGGWSQAIQRGVEDYVTQRIPFPFRNRHKSGLYCDRLINRCFRLDPHYRSTPFKLLNLKVMAFARDPRTLNPLLARVNELRRGFTPFVCNLTTNK